MAKFTKWAFISGFLISLLAAPSFAMTLTRAQALAFNSLLRETGVTHIDAQVGVVYQESANDRFFPISRIRHCDQSIYFISVNDIDSFHYFTAIPGDTTDGLYTGRTYINFLIPSRSLGTAAAGTYTVYNDGDGFVYDYHGHDLQDILLSMVSRRNAALVQQTLERSRKIVEVFKHLHAAARAVAADDILSARRVLTEIASVCPVSTSDAGVTRN